MKAPMKHMRMKWATDIIIVPCKVRVNKVSQKMHKYTRCACRSVDLLLLGLLDKYTYVCESRDWFLYSSCWWPRPGASSLLQICLLLKAGRNMRFPLWALRLLDQQTARPFRSPRCSRYRRPCPPAELLLRAELCTNKHMLTDNGALKS